MPLFGPPAHPTQKAPPEVNRFWRRLMWDTELNRLYSHLDQVSHSIDSHQRTLYLENTFHDQARDRAQQLYADKLSRENVGLFKRLLAVHTRKPREFITHHVQNPKTHSRFLEYQRVMEDNHRLVDRLLKSRTFVNERGSWDEHAQEHEEILTRLSHNPKNCFIPNLQAKRRRDRALMKQQSVAQQAAGKIRARAFQASSAILSQAWVDGAAAAKGGVVYEHSPRAQPKYAYPLPPDSIATDPADFHTVMSSPRSRTGAPSVLIPTGTHLVAPALVDQEQYELIAHSLQQMQQQEQQNQQGFFPRNGEGGNQGELHDSLLTIPMPPPSPSASSSSLPLARAQANSAFSPRIGKKGSAAQDNIFYLHPPSAAPSVAASAASSSAAQESSPISYPFSFPALETREGSPLAYAREARQIETQQSQGQGGSNNNTNQQQQQLYANEQQRRAAQDAEDAASIEQQQQQQHPYARAYQSTPSSRAGSFVAPPSAAPASSIGAAGDESSRSHLISPAVPSSDPSAPATDAGNNATEQQQQQQYASTATAAPAPSSSSSAALCPSPSSQRFLAYFHQTASLHDPSSVAPLISPPHRSQYVSRRQSDQTDLLAKAAHARTTARKLILPPVKGVESKWRVAPTPPSTHRASSASAATTGASGRSAFAHSSGSVFGVGPAGGSSGGGIGNAPPPSSSRTQQASLERMVDAMIAAQEHAAAEEERAKNEHTKKKQQMQIKQFQQAQQARIEANKQAQIVLANNAQATNNTQQPLTAAM